MKWHPIHDDGDLPRKHQWVLVTVRGEVDVARRETAGRHAFWTCFGKPSAWAELPAPYRKENR